jgi:uncharacterized protein YyaL (SSP411 family)
MNRLADAASPYLRQHADNPVDWYPWGPEALARARAEDKPILLSIGYSACHWCHVMAHESFADPATAAVMNARFVNIKVDREERPDLDRIYQTAHHFIAQRAGGWPLTMFLTPDEHAPFFGGTYFPPEARGGLPAFRDLLTRVADYYAANAAALAGQGEALRGAFDQLEAPPADAGTVLDAGPLAAFRAAVAGTVDREWGGFGRAPKFPHPTLIDRLLRHWHRTARGQDPDTDALYLAALTLQRMAEGGIHDQLGGGFCRYSVDGEWRIPHFEKMLYDNGPLLALYAQLYQVGGDEAFGAVARGIGDWALGEMRAPGGAFYASLDADSEGIEGKYYLWTPDAARALLTADEYAVTAPRFGLDREPNFYEPHHDLSAWHLAVYASEAEVATATGLPVARVRELLGSATAKLRAARGQRVRPGRDDKLLTGWNALMIRGLAVAGRILNRDAFIDAAGAAAGFVRSRLRDERRLYATATDDGRSDLPAYLDDYAYLLDASLELLQARFDPAVLADAVWLAERLLADFEATDRGGFWFTAHDHEPLLHRGRPFADEATPSGNGVAAGALLRLGWLLAEPRYLAAAERTLRAGWPALAEYPQGHASLLNALEDWLAPPAIVVIRGDAEAAAPFRATLTAAYHPRRLVLVIPPDTPGLPPALAAKAAGPGVTAWVCRGSHCDPPQTDLAALAAALAAD